MFYDILTPSGYKDLSLINIGDEITHYDTITGNPAINHILKKEIKTKANWNYKLLDHTEEVLEKMQCTGFDAITGEYHYNPVYTYNDIYKQDPFDFYIINKTSRRFKYESIWVKLPDNTYQVKHIQELKKGDIIINGSDNEVVVDSITLSPGTDADVYYRLEVDGDHSYISNDVTYHNASRYWNGTGNWGTATYWFADDSHATPAAVPTATDYAYFTSNSTGTCTVSTTSYCGGIDFTGYAGAFAGGSYLYCAGDVTLSPLTTISFTGYLRLNISNSVSNFTSNGVALAFPLRLENSVTMKLIDNFKSTTSSPIYITAGSLDANGKDFTMQCSTGMNIPGLTFYNLYVLGSNTWQSINVTIAPFKILNHLEIAGYNAQKRIWLNMYQSKYNITLDGSATASFTNVDICSVQGVSTNGNTWWADNILTGCGDIGNNTNLRFEPSVTAYYVPGVSPKNWSDSNCWFTASGGVIPTRSPLCHDTVIIDENSNQDITIDVPFIGSLDCSRASGIKLNLSPGNSLRIVGTSIKMSSNLTPNPVDLNVYTQNNTLEITTNGYIFQQFFLTSYNAGVYKIMDSCYLNASILLYGGDLLFNNQPISCAGINADASSQRSINWGDGSVPVICRVTTNGATPVNLNGTYLNLYGSANIKIICNNGSVSYVSTYQNSRAIDKLTLSGSVNYNLRFASNQSRIREVIFDISENTKGLQIAAGVTQYIDKLTAIGTAERMINVNCVTSGSKGTIDLVGKKSYCDYLNIKDITATNGTLYAGSHSIDGGNNTGVIFSSGMNSSFLSALMSL